MESPWMLRKWSAGNIGPKSQNFQIVIQLDLTKSSLMIPWIFANQPSMASSGLFRIHSRLEELAKMCSRQPSLTFCDPHQLEYFKISRFVGGNYPFFVCAKYPFNLMSFSTVGIPCSSHHLDNRASFLLKPSEKRSRQLTIAKCFCC